MDNPMIVPVALSLPHVENAFMHWVLINLEVNSAARNSFLVLIRSDAENLIYVICISDR